MRKNLLAIVLIVVVIGCEFVLGACTSLIEDTAP